MGCIPIRPLRLWQWETAPNGLPQRQRLIHPSAQHRSNYLRSTQILCEGDSFANFKVLVWGIGACWILSGDGGYWVPSSCSPFALLNLAVTILFSFYSFSFYFFFYFFSFFGRCHLCTPPCLTSVSGSHLLQTYGTQSLHLVTQFWCATQGTLLDHQSKGGLLSLLVLELWP